MDLEAAIRLVIAAGCAGTLIWVRWRYERVRWLGTSEGRSQPVWAHPRRVTWLLYWLGLTTSAVLAGQAVASLAAS